MTDIRNLRLAVQSKLEDRRRLLSENTNLRQDLRRSGARNDFLLETLGNPLINRELERCADEIVNAILERAIEASSVIAEQTIEDGDYEIGIDIPSLYIRRRFYRESVNSFRDYNKPTADKMVRNVRYNKI